MICSVDDCFKETIVGIYCRTHYHRFLRHGKPEGSGRTIRGSAKQFIVDNIHHEGEDCLIWPFNRSSKHGYGVINRQHFGSGLAHRSMCIAAHGKPPTDKHEAAHSCGRGNKGCINPRHLSWKTPVENADDKKMHGTQPWGQLMWHKAKLTFDQARYAKYSTEDSKSLADRFGVREETILRIRRGETWRGL